MNDKLKQDLSALLDGEIDELGLARVLAESENVELRKQVVNYTHLQSLFHSEDINPSAFSIDISTAVKEQIIKEGITQDDIALVEVVDVNNSQKSQAGTASWFKPAVGFAMAASMAFVTVFSLDYFGQDDQVLNIASTNISDVSRDAPILNSNVKTVSYGQVVATQPSNSANNARHISLAEEELNDPFQVAVIADQKLRERENALLEEQKKNTELQQRLREYLISHARQNLNAPVNTALPIARASHTGY